MSLVLILVASSGGQAIEAGSLIVQTNPDAAIQALLALQPDQRETVERLLEAAGGTPAELLEAATGNTRGTLPRYDGPSEAIRDLLRRHDVKADPAQQSLIQSLNTLPPAIANALTRLVASYILLEDASHMLHRYPIRSVMNDHDLPYSKATAALLFDARINILEEAERFADAIGYPGLNDTVPGMAASSNGNDGPLPLMLGEEIRVPPVFALDIDALDSTYTDDYFLVIDVGGNDRYDNNAGGSSVMDPDRILVGDPCEDHAQPPTVDPTVRTYAALVDLAGNDVYGGRPCGVNGGGYYGVGFLYDRDGDDQYLSSHSTTCIQILGTGIGRGACAVNGGGLRGSGALIDAAGNDQYLAVTNRLDPGVGTNGGAYVAGSGILLDLGGNDLYMGGRSGTILFDGTGNDRYLGGEGGTNGGGDGGLGLLLDDGTGDDEYIGDSYGTNGGSSLAAKAMTSFLGAGQRDWLTASGLLWDSGGDDHYESRATKNSNGHGAGTAGALIDLGGMDTYVSNGATRTDRTEFPKGEVGGQIDA
ncbi:MAG: hypothetical protein ACPGQL_05385 [Thermoplasmatota archaeon]